MAKRRVTSDQSPKQAILICLGICIPLIIALGVATYFGFAGQKEVDAKAATAQQNQAKADKARGDAEKQLTLMKAYVGLGLDQKEGDIGTIHDQPGSDQAAATMVKDLDSMTGWDPVKRAPKETLKKRIQDLNTSVEEATKK